MESEKKQHWETVYETKTPSEVSWTQENPATSLALIHELGISKHAEIIDIGGGDSKLVDFLLREGFENITVLDISAKSLERAKERLGEGAERVTWIVSDVTEFKPTKSYDLWHDRAAFHFLTTEEQKATYGGIVAEFVTGVLVIGTFSENGPLKCSGLEISQYSKESLAEQFSNDFDLVKSVIEDHETPFGTTQNFVFGAFRKRNVHAQ